jgi:hypothetical protein
MERGVQKGSKKTIKDGNMIVDRDINGARGILLKQLIRGNLHLNHNKEQLCVLCD